MPDALAQLAEHLRPTLGAKMRVGLITGLDVSTGEVRATTDVTGDARIATNSDATFSLGDRVLLLQQGAAWVVVVRLSGVQPVAVPVGSITSYAGAVAPTGWLLCNGAPVARATYPDLFAVCGSTYGPGDGTSTFNVPNLTSRFPLGAGSKARGASGGAETVTLTSDQMPKHTHTLGNAGESQGFSGLTRVSDGDGDWLATNADATTGEAGGGQSHENMPPFLAVQFIIKAS